MDRIIENYGYSEEDNRSGYVVKVRCSICGRDRIELVDESMRIYHECDCKAIERERIAVEMADSYPSVGLFKNNIRCLSTFYNNGVRMFGRCETCRSTKVYDFNKWKNLGYKCNCRTESKGAHIIRQILSSHQIPFQSEVMFDNLVSDKGSQLRYDFGLMSFDYTKVLALIEYDGTSHRRKHRGMTDAEFSRIKYLDNVKDKFAEENHITLLRISSNTPRVLFNDLVLNLVRNIYNMNLKQIEHESFVSNVLINEYITAISTPYLDKNYK